MKERNVRLFAFISYILAIINIQVDFENIIIKSIFVLIFSFTFSGYVFYDNENKKHKKIAHEEIKQELKKIFKEILLFIPIMCANIIITKFFFVGVSKNQSSVSEIMEQYFIPSLFLIILIGPIIEEIIFRYLPRGFLKNKVLYIIISSIIFAGIHVIGDENMINHLVTGYLIDSLYYAYRYSKTNDIIVTMSLHSFHNLITTIISFLF